MNSLQDVAAALELAERDPAPLCLEKVGLLWFLVEAVISATFVLEPSIAFLLADRAAAFSFSWAAETAQAAMEVTASSSYFRHLEKASLHAFRPWAMADTSAILQSFTASLAAAMSSLAQQVQASPAVASLLLVMQSVAMVTKLAVALAQASTKVMLGMGKSVVQEALTATSQSNSVLVRLVSCLAPSESAEPEQVRADLLPPPRSTSLRAMGANTAFLSDFLPAMVACFSILVFCFSKFATTSFHLLITVMALSKHLPSIVLEDFLEPLRFFRFLIFLLFLLGLPFFPLLLFLFFLFLLFLLIFICFFELLEMLLFFLFLLFFSFNSFLAFLFSFLIFRRLARLFPPASANLATRMDAAS